MQTRPTHTLVFVSTDGGAFGARSAPRASPRPRPTPRPRVAVVNLDAIAGPGPPRLLIAGDTPARRPRRSCRTASARVLEESGQPPASSPAALRQLLDLGFPFTLGEQAPFVARGIPALTHDDGDGAAARALADARLHPQRLDELGRAAQSLLGSLDAGLELGAGRVELRLPRHAHRPRLGDRARADRDAAAVRASVRSTCSPAAGGVGFRSRRRSQPPQPAALLGIRGAAAVRGRPSVGVFGEGEPRPLPAGRARRLARLRRRSGLLGTLLLAGWLVGRDRLDPATARVDEETVAGHTAALLALGLIALLVVATNPFALIFVLPSLHAWLWLPQAHDSEPGRARRALRAGLAGPLLLLVSLADASGSASTRPRTSCR